jgi:hypothetical protein
MPMPDICGHVNGKAAQCEPWPAKPISPQAGSKMQSIPALSPCIGDRVLSRANVYFVHERMAISLRN